LPPPGGTIAPRSRRAPARDPVHRRRRPPPVAAKKKTKSKRALVAALASRRKYRAVAGWTLASLITAWTAIVAKEAGSKPPVLADIRVPVSKPEPRRAAFVPATRALGAPEAEEPVVATPDEFYPPEVARFAADASVRWFNGRPVRPVKEISMVVTAYSPDERSCGEFADGMTATLHSVHTNDHALVAADPAVLRYGSMLTIPGYDEGRIVPVLDCGGAIKGRRLDVLYPTHERAREWGRRTLRVTVWEYADGRPAENPRRER
jgi:3D (Asp-Asp-Asp) domain-containing protein